MPIIANAKKALRQTKTRTERNRVVRAQVRTVIKKAEKQAEPTTLNKLFSAIDKAVKRNLMHKNKAARIKSRITKKAAAPATAEVKKTVARKAAPKKATKNSKATKTAKTAKKK